MLAEDVAASSLLLGGKTPETFVVARKRHEGRGSTVVDIEPRSKDRALVDWDKGIYFPLYRRSEYRADKAPWHTVHRFVAEKILPLQ